MPRARRFTFGPYTLDPDRSAISCTYYVDLEAGGRETYTEIVEFPGATKDMWERVPEPLRSSLLQGLILCVGVHYWKLHLAPEICIQGFDLTRQQAQFWDEVYLKSLGELFYNLQIDFRRLISFPYNASLEEQAHGPTHFPRSPRMLLLNGGGKDSIVSAEILSEHQIPFEMISVNPSGVQDRVASIVGCSTITVRRRRDPTSLGLQRYRFVSIPTFTFVASVAAALHDYRYVVLSNESSADISNLHYLGLNVNHQWSKSSEAQRLVSAYFARYITEDIESLSILKRYTEIEIVRRFSAYPQYFSAFSSCNMFYQYSSSRQERPYWCNKCPKCIFIFACLSAFLPKQTVVDITGSDLYADRELLPLYRRLLGLEGFKPFECVGTPEEMIIAMHRAEKTGSYDGEAAIDLFTRDVPRTLPFEEMERRVFSAQNPGSMPAKFTASFGLE